MSFVKSAASAFAISVIAANAAVARDQIRIVGSSTVFPFSTAVAEQFGKSTDFQTPVVEATGSGGGLKLFCSGIGVETPDITNSSRRIKISEVDKCASNGINEIIASCTSGAQRVSSSIRAICPSRIAVRTGEGTSARSLGPSASKSA